MNNLPVPAFIGYFYSTCSSIKNCTLNYVNIKHKAVCVSATNWLCVFNILSSQAKKKL